jgi:hypothetical protein
MVQVARKSLLRRGHPKDIPCVNKLWGPSKAYETGIGAILDSTRTSLSNLQRFYVREYHREIVVEHPATVIPIPLKWEATIHLGLAKGSSKWHSIAMEQLLKASLMN